MAFFDLFRRSQPNDPNEFWIQLSKKVNLDRSSLQEMTEDELGERISEAQSAYRRALSADRAGEFAFARRYYQQAFTLLPTHIEALDNFAIGLVEELNFSEAIPLFEQSAVAEPNSPLAFVYLVKCYEEVGDKHQSAACAQYLLHHWPDQTPYLDWSHLGKPKEKHLLASPLEEGQVWNYQARDCDDKSTVWIKLIEQGSDERVIVHISVTDVQSPDGVSRFISHLPYDADALRACLTSQLDVKQMWDREDDHFGNGYGIWLDAYNSGDAGVFTAPLDEIIEGMLQSIPRDM